MTRPPDGTPPPPPHPDREPPAELRQMAGGLWNTYLAMRQAGFSEGQTLRIIGYIFAAEAAARGGQPS